MCNLSNFQYTMEELNMIMDMVKQEMDAAIKHLDHAFQKIRAGRASTSMVQDVVVEYTEQCRQSIKWRMCLFQMR